jgi:hypothetical protein
MPDLSTVNWLAAIAGAVAFFILGALWYGPLFSKTWAAGMGLDPEAGMGSGTTNYAITAVVALVLSVAVATLTADAATTMDAVAQTVWLWLGVVATTAAMNAVWDPRPWSVYGINVGYQLVGMVLVAVIASAWPA